MPSGDKIRVMWLSDSLTTITGFANQSRQICQTLSESDEFEVTNISWNIVTQPIKKIIFEDGTEHNFKILGGGKSQYAQDILPEYFASIRPHVFGVLLDTFMLYPWILGMDFAPAKSVMYFPSDGEYFPLECEKILQKFSHPVAMSKFAKEQVEKLFGIRCHYIPHGCDTGKFYPILEEKRAEVRAKLGIPEDAFVVGVVARNQPRKNLGATITTFKEFAKDKDDVILLLHTDMADPAAPCHLPALIQRCGLERKVRTTGMKFFLGAQNDMMRDIYGVMDVHYLTTTGEGFGIPIIESLACCVPNIVTSYTTAPEILGYDMPADWKEGDIIMAEAGIGVPIAAEIVGSWNVNRGFIDEKKAINALQYAYDNKEQMRKLGERGRKRVVENYDFLTVIGPMWKAYLREVSGQ